MTGDPAMALQAELGPNERLLWSGRPRGGLVLRANDLFLIPFSLLWAGFAVFWECSVLGISARHPSPTISFMALWGLPFVGAGLYVVAGRFFADKAQRESTVYGVTNQRVLIRSGLFSTTTRSFPLQGLAELSLQEKGDGSGTISLGTALSPFPFALGRSSWPGMGRYQPPALDLIPSARTVYNLIRDAQQPRI